MSDLIFFEWEKCPDGYTVETFRSEFIRFDTEEFVGGRWSNMTLWRLLAYPSDDAPEWVRNTIDHPYKNPWANEAQYGSKEGALNAISSLEKSALIDDRFIVPRSNKVVRFQPLENSDAAFMELAECGESEDKIARFVSAYGYPFSAEDVFEMGIKWTFIVEFDAFLEKAYEMRDGVSIWRDAKETGEYKRLFLLVNELSSLPKEDVDDEEFDKINLDRELDYHPLLSKDLSDSIQRGIQLGVKLRPSLEHGGAPVLSLVPENLDDALWFQFTQAVSNNMNIRSCDACSKWYEVAPGKGRPEKLYCSNACSMRAYRKRKKAQKDNG